MPFPVNYNPATYGLNSDIRFVSRLNFSLVISLRQKPYSVWLSQTDMRPKTKAVWFPNWSEELRKLRLPPIHKQQYRVGIISYNYQHSRNLLVAGQDSATVR